MAKYLWIAFCIIFWPVAILVVFVTLVMLAAGGGA